MKRCVDGGARLPVYTVRWRADEKGINPYNNRINRLFQAMFIVDFKTKTPTKTSNPHISLFIKLILIYLLHSALAYP